MRNYLKIFNEIKDRLVTINLGTDPDEDGPIEIEPVPCATFKELIDDHYGEVLYLTDDIVTTAACMAAVIVSTTTQGGQLGLRVIGKPGSAKSTLAEAFSVAREYVYPRSKFTGIVSGWASISKGNQTAEKLNGKCLIIKDADTMLQLPNLRQVESELRDVLGDGVIRGEYRTGLEFEIETVFTVIECGTQALRGTDDAALGSRFLDITISGASEEKADEIVGRSIDSQFDTIVNSLASKGEESNRKKGIERMGAPTLGFLNRLKDLLDSGELEVKPLTDKQKERIKGLGKYIAVCRAKVDRQAGGDLKYRPEKELATRVSEQLTRLAVFLAIVLLPENRTKAQITNQVMDILHKVAVDTAYGFKADIARHLYEVDKGRRTPLGASVAEISDSIDLSQTHIRNVIKDMAELKMVERREVNNGKGAGRKTHTFTLTKEMKELMK